MRRLIANWACRGGAAVMPALLALSLVSPARAGDTPTQSADQAMSHQVMMDQMMMGQSMMTQASLVRSLLPTVVNITAKAEVSSDNSPVVASASSGSLVTQTSAGSGFIIDPSGIIVTNWHVVSGAYEIIVTFSDGARAPANILNAARIVDLALLKVTPPHPLIAAHWGNSDEVQVGDPVLAIGNPLGVGMTVTSGIVSALNRNIMDTPYDDFIQTDAPINHGNSGGPLFDMAGKVIGVNAAIISPTSASAGLGFAIPANDAHFVAERLLRYGWVRPGFLGVKVQQVTPDMAVALGMKQPEGSIVANVIAQGPASKAGLEIGDVILKFGTKSPPDERALLRDIASTQSGTQVPVAVLRDGQPLTLTVTIAEWPKSEWEERDEPTKVIRPHLDIPANLGLTLAPLTQESRAKYGLQLGQNGVLITGVAAGTDAAQRGLTPGDVILQVKNSKVNSPNEFQTRIDEARRGHDPLVMLLLLPREEQNPGPKWVPVQISAG
ncbi:MAG TPA: trypsin-like peptidase domain-containing protein [Acetobacteraceae bacterium]|nr:trypsin-like peptidase domain-containing protein [Acetobacteraceae bacterium]